MHMMLFHDFKLSSVKILHLGLMVSLAALTACGGGVGEGSQTADPVVVDIPVVYVKRNVAAEVRDGMATGALQADNLSNPAAFVPGAHLVLRERASPSAPERILTDSLWAAGAEYDVKDLAVADDGSKVLFAMRAPEIEDADDDEQPSWNIWEYDVLTAALHRVIEQDNVAEEGHDTAPAYLPNGRIVFSSTRQHDAKAILLNEDKPQYAALARDRQPASVIHVMDADGGNIEQLSFSHSHEYDPTPLLDGRIVFSRNDADGTADGVHFYVMNTDGTDLQLFYGGHSHDSGANGSEVHFFRPTLLPDGGLAAMVRPLSSSYWGGDVQLIDVAGFIDHNQPVPDNSASADSAQQSVAFKTIRTDSAISEGGYIAAFAPLWDATGRMIMSWMPCRLLSTDNRILPCTAENQALEGVREADANYGLWVYDPAETTLLPIIFGESGSVISDIVVLEDKSPAYPASLPAVELDSDLLAAGLGAVHIRSIYDLAGEDIASPSIAALSDPSVSPRSSRTAQFLRLIKPMSLPDRDDINNVNVGRFDGFRGTPMTEILGYVPIEPDGSVKFTVPARVPFGFEIVDAQGRRLDTPAPFSAAHRRWLQVLPGETLQCQGCHATTGDGRYLPHGRSDAEAPSANAGLGATGSAFPGTKEAIWGDFGQSMAEVFDAYAQRTLGVDRRTPSFNIAFQDDWAPEDIAASPESYLYRWFELNGVLPETSSALMSFTLAEVDNEDGQETEQEQALPLSRSCERFWKPRCRNIINYPEHIQPIWEALRAPAATGAIGDEDGLVSCVQCHRYNEEDLVPLDLTNDGGLSSVLQFLDRLGTLLRTYVEEEASAESAAIEAALLAVLSNLSSDTFETCIGEGAAPRLAISYCSLLARNISVDVDSVAELVALLDLPEDVDPATITEASNLVSYIKASLVNEAGEPDVQAILDFIQVLGDLVSVQNPTMSANGARASSAFFDRFENPPGAGQIDHRGLLGAGELRLLYEWLDLGAQYYNNAFDIPGAVQ
jgi:hypothetical protein